MGLFKALFGRKKSKNSNSKPSSDGNCTVEESSSSPPASPVTSSSSNNNEDDDMSVDAPVGSSPSPSGVMQWNQHGFSAYGDRSVYDGGSLSSEGLTIGNHSFATSAFNSVNRSVFSDDSSFFQQSCQSLNMEVVQIYAPPGKLGIALDTPEDTGAPIVHYVKDISPIHGKILVDDKLIAIDDEDVTYMTAVKISKILNRKSNNVTRKLTVLRAVRAT